MGVERGEKTIEKAEEEGRGLQSGTGGAAHNPWRWKLDQGFHRSELALVGVELTLLCVCSM